MSNFEMQGSFLNGESLPEGSPAKTSVSPENALDLAVRALDSSGKSFAFLTNSNPDSSSLKTYLVYCPPTTDEILEPSSGRWLGGGMGSRTGFLTLNTSEWPREGAVCSLSDVLETTGAHLAKYSLSPKACAGILRRAERRGKKLPPMLERALRQVSSQCEKDQRGGGKGPLVSEDVSLTLATGNGQVLIANPLGTKRRLDLDNETYVTQERVVANCLPAELYHHQSLTNQDVNSNHLVVFLDKNDQNKTLSFVKVVRSGARDARGAYPQKFGPSARSHRR